MEAGVIFTQCMFHLQFTSYKQAVQAGFGAVVGKEKNKYTQMKKKNFSKDHKQTYQQQKKTTKEWLMANGQLTARFQQVCT